MFFSGASAAWSFIERVGNEGGHDAVTVGNILSLSLLFATLGALLVAWISDRFGFLRPFVLTTMLFLVGLGVLLGAADLNYFGVGACIVNFSIGIAIPVMLSITAKLDTDGRYIVLTVSALGMGGMIGPGIAGLLTGGVSFTPILLFAGGCAVFSILLVSLALASGKSQADSDLVTGEGVGQTS